MKTLFLKIVTIAFAVTAMVACSKPSYLGKTYEPTQKVDVFLEHADIPKSYEVICEAKITKGPRSLEFYQNQLVEFAKSKGADGIIIKRSEREATTQQGKSGSVTQGKRGNATYNETSSATTLTETRLEATFVKYRN